MTTTGQILVHGLREGGRGNGMKNRKHGRLEIALRSNRTAEVAVSVIGGTVAAAVVMLVLLALIGG